MASADVTFWQTEGINELHSSTKDVYYEGFDNANAVVQMAGTGTVCDVGCGYGRLAPLYDASKYVGYDLCQSAITKAQKLNPTYQFNVWEYMTALPAANVTMFINGPHLVNNDEIQALLNLMCSNTSTIILAEPMKAEYATRWSNLAYKVYHRDIATYDAMLSNNGFTRTNTHTGPHFLFPDVEYTAARWDKTT